VAKKRLDSPDIIIGLQKVSGKTVSAVRPVVNLCCFIFSSRLYFNKLQGHVLVKDGIIPKTGFTEYG
jgi:hypothetical protein